MPKIKTKNLRRNAQVEMTVDMENSVVEFSFSSEEPVERHFGMEILSHDMGAMDMSRINAKAAPFLWNHDPGQPIGMIESGLVKEGRGFARAKFFSTPFAQEKLTQMNEGLRNISFGYQPKDFDMIRAPQNGEPAVYRVSRYEVFEISQVSIPADFSIGVGRADADLEIEFEVKELEQNPKGDRMTPEEIKAMQEKERAERARIETEVRTAEKNRTAQIRALCADHKLADLESELINSDKTIEQARAAVLEKIKVRQVPVNPNAAAVGLTDEEASKFSIVRALHALANPGDSKAQEAAKFEREVSAAAEKSGGKSSRGLMIPIDVLRAGRRDLVVGTANLGGNAVATNLLSGSFIELLRKKMVLSRLGAQTLNGLVGNISIPKLSGAATAYWVGESAPVTESNQAFGQLNMSPKTVGGMTDISRKLLLQGSIDVEAMVRNDLAMVLGLEIDRVGLYGTGSSNMPKGLFPLVLEGLINTVDFSAADPTWAEIVKMESEVAADDADIGTLAYAFNARARGVLKTTEKASNTGIFLLDANGKELNGYRTECSNQILSLNTTEHDYWFGNWNDFIMAFWSGVDLLVDPYTGAAAGTVRVIAHQDVDMGVRHGESFCYGNKTVTLS